MSQTDAIKGDLERRLAELTEKAHDIDDALREPHSQDWEEKATEIEGEEVMEDMGNHVLAEISEIKAALKRLEKGTFGTCTLCGEEIEAKRLSALPTAAQCLTCAISTEAGRG